MTITTSIIGAGGELYLTCEDFTELKAQYLAAQHGQHRHSNVLCGRRNGHPRKRNRFGKEPPTQQQIEAMAKTVAVLTYVLGLEIKLLTVTTHCEAALFDGYGPHSGDPGTRWDLWYLPDRRFTAGLCRAATLSAAKRCGTGSLSAGAIMS